MPGDFSYVGMTTDNQGVALKSDATNSYWLTVNGDDLEREALPLSGSPDRDRRTVASSR